MINLIILDAAENFPSNLSVPSMIFCYFGIPFNFIFLTMHLFLDLLQGCWRGFSAELWVRLLDLELLDAIV